MPRESVTVTVRFGRPSDAPAVGRLSALEGRAEPPPAPLLVAEVNGIVRAARSLESGESVADPFESTAHLTDLLEIRLEQLRHAAEGPRPRRRRHPRAKETRA